MGDEAAAFCQAIVEADEEIPDEQKQGVRLVVQASSDTRDTNAQYTPASAYSLWGKRPAVALTDGFPILLANQASLDELNRRLVKKGKAAIPKLDKIAIKKMKPAALKEALKERDLEYQGNAKELQKRLLDYEAAR